MEVQAFVSQIIYLTIAIRIETAYLKGFKIDYSRVFEGVLDSWWVLAS